MPYLFIKSYKNLWKYYHIYCDKLSVKLFKDLTFCYEEKSSDEISMMVRK